MANNTNGLMRPHYFERQQLRAVDLGLEQAYLRERLRRHNRFLHGWGVVCGLQVTAPASAPAWEVSIGAGYAVTPHGDELYIPDQTRFNLQPGIEDCLGLPSPCPDPESLTPPATDRSVQIIRARIDPPTAGTPHSYNDEWVDLLLLQPANLSGYTLDHVTNPGMPNEGREGFYTFPNNQSFTAGTVIRIHSGAQRFHLEPEPEMVHRYRASSNQVGNWRLNNGGDTIFLSNAQGQPVHSATFVPGSLLPIGEGIVYLVACPADELRCPQPAVPANCQPPGGIYEYSRIWETVQFKVVCDLPPSHQQEGPDCETLEEIVCGQTHVPCPSLPAASDNCVVLARLAVGGESLLHIDDLSDRRQLLSESLLQAYVRCHCEEAEPPAADFVNQPQGGSAPLTVSFTDQSSGQITNWAWSFGDGGTSSQQNPIHVYQSPGTYLITLTVIGPGGSDTASRAISVSPPRGIERIAPSTITGNFFTVTQHQVAIFGQGLVGATAVTFANSSNAVAAVTITGQLGNRLDLLVTLRANPTPTGPRPFTISFTDGTQLSSGSVQLNIQVEFFINVSGSRFEIMLDETVFDLERGREESIDVIQGIGTVRGERLREAGADTLVAIAALPPERMATIAGVSPEVAGQWQAEARELLRR
jgi:PKD repeat protein